MNLKPEGRRGPRFWFVVTASTLSVLIAVVAYPPGAQDWYQTFRPAARALVAGQNPYSVPRFCVPPWSLLPLAPIAFLPEGLDLLVFTLVALIAIAITAVRLEGNEFTAAAIQWSLPAVFLLSNGNIDWLVALGFALPPALGLFLVTLKPQVGFGVAVFWFIRAWQEGGWRGTARTFAPVTLAFLLTSLLYGPWPLKMLDIIANGYSGFFPWSIPIGIILLVAAVRKRESAYSIGAGPMFAPYLEFHSWTGALFALVKMPRILVSVVAAIWIAAAVWVFGGF